jgi:uncharacterized protein (TIRG00374 family)
VKKFVLGMLVLGTVLLAVVLWQTNLSEVGMRLREVGPWAALGILAAYFVGYLLFAVSWLLTVRGVPFRPRWIWRIWRVLMVGSALEAITPFAGLGGEPVKAILLKRHYGIPFTDGAASLVLTRMMDLIAQLIVISVGLILIVRADVLPPAYRAAAGAGFGIFALAILGFLLVQIRRGFSRLRAWLERRPLGKRLPERVVEALDSVHEVEDQLITFYASQRPRAALAVTCALAEWSGNAVATWIAMNALGYPIGFTDAIVIEAFVVLVRSTLFFVPGDIGTQEAAQVLICAALTGSPEAGLALATIRRARDLLWIACGLAIGGTYSIRNVTEFQPPPTPGSSASPSS